MGPFKYWRKINVPPTKFEIINTQNPKTRISKYIILLCNASFSTEEEEDVK